MPETMTGPMAGPMAGAMAGAKSGATTALRAAPTLTPDLVAERAPLGGLERWLDDPSVDEVMVNGNGTVWVERGGTITAVGALAPGTVLGVLERILAPIGRRLDRSSPTVDARLPDGSRVCAVIPPVAVDGPVVAIRRFRSAPFPLDAFADVAMAALLRRVVDQRRTLLVSGATSSGKTSLLNALATHVGPDERIITIEDTAELRLDHRHVVRLESRPATPEGVGEVGLDHLVRTALRLRPDRLVIGEVRGREAVPLLHALHTGHSGSMATVHANSAVDALGRLAALVTAEVGNWSTRAVQSHVARAIDVVVHLSRDALGRRYVDHVVGVGAVTTRGFQVIPMSPTADGLAS